MNVKSTGGEGMSSTLLTSSTVGPFRALSFATNALKSGWFKTAGRVVLFASSHWRDLEADSLWKKSSNKRGVLGGGGKYLP
jgi:hypothetical protein